jgi:predicted DCC family thiol-disulfide oxidoreductase YuxK
MRRNDFQSFPTWQIQVFYDGDCPLCVREISFLKRLDKRQQIRFTDIAAKSFESSDYGISQETLMSVIHGRLPDGTWIRGVEVFRRLYAAVGLGSIVWMTRLPVVSRLLDGGYKLFARNRLKWTGRCSSDDKTRCYSTGKLQ